MQLVKLTQGSQEWLSWRREHITASDCSSIMGCNPYKNILKLYDQKIFCIEQPDNPYMQRGRELEPIALQKFESDTGFIMFPCVIQSDNFNWMGASLDGMTIDQTHIVEIKCNGKKSHDMALAGEIPAHYQAQIQHQLACTELDFSYYYSFDGEQGVILEVQRDQQFIDKMIEKEIEFLHNLLSGKPPILPKRKKHATSTI